MGVKDKSGENIAYHGLVRAVRKRRSRSIAMER